MPEPARADAIDGQWCLGSSHFAIDGPSILTPGGNRIQGNYSRHGFFYVVPANEPGAGGEIDMVLLNEETVQLTRRARRRARKSGAAASRRAEDHGWSAARSRCDDVPTRRRTTTAPEASRLWQPTPGAISSACFSPRPTGCRRVGPRRPARARRARHRRRHVRADGGLRARPRRRAQRPRHRPLGCAAARVPGAPTRAWTTLRSPKHLTGPDLGFPALTFRAWYEAQHGADGWQRLYKIATSDWLAYLLWVRDTVPIAVENGVEATLIDLDQGFVRVQLAGPGGAETVYARRSCWPAGAMAPARPTRRRSPRWSTPHRPTAPASSTPATASTLPASEAARSACSAPAPRPSTTPPWLSRPGRRR